MENSIKIEKQCHFCQNNMIEIDYKDATLLRKFVGSYMKILSRKKTGTCAKHQRKLATAIKQSRMMALMPFVNQ
ncbi:MAG: 30S ribosomal protein S18 [Candidatus Falkowbacteria bacterium]